MADAQAAFTVSEAINKGFELTKKHWARFLVLIIGAVIVFGAISIASSIIFGDKAAGQIIVQLISLILSSIATIIFTRFTLNAYDGKSTAFEVLLKMDLKLVLFVTIFGILYGLGVMLGLLFFIIPGFILGLGWYFGQYLIIDKNMDLLESFKVSWHITKGHRARLLLFCLAVILPVVALAIIFAVLVVGAMMAEPALALLGILAIVLLLVVAVATEMVASFGLTHIYRKLESRHHAS